MTEAEWLNCTDPQKMLELLHGRASERKLRLLAVAVYRNLSGNARVANTAERLADGTASARQLREEVDEELWHASTWYRHMGAEEVETVRALLRGIVAPRAAEAAELMVEAAGVDGAGASCGLLRDVFGNPFRPATVDPSWLAWNDGTVIKMAQAIYDDRAFDRLPILADALEDAGCTNEDILTHCRQPGEHVRGCWVVDLLLGKS
jgi:hypothetical protein